MKKREIEIISFLDLKNLSINVTEEINKKNLIKFLRTTILNSDLIISSNLQFYYSFIKSNMSYEIIIFEKPNNQQLDFIFEPFIFLGYYKKKDKNSIDLFYGNDYFVLYENKKPILFKKISQTIKEDIILYISQTYKIAIDNIFKIDKQFYENIKKEYFLTYYNKNDICINSLYVDKSFKNLKIFILTVTLIFSYIIFNKINGKEILSKSSKKLILLENKYNNLSNIYQQHNKKPINNMVDLFKYIKINRIKIHKIFFKNKKLQTILINKDKSKLLNMITSYSNNIQIQSIYYDKVELLYKMEVSIEY
jgi:hypothetical protein